MGYHRFPPFFLTRVSYCSPDGEVRIGGIAHGCGFVLIDFKMVAGSLVSGLLLYHSCFTFLDLLQSLVSGLFEFLS
jgi:hypothetical protein